MEALIVYRQVAVTEGWASIFSTIVYSLQLLMHAMMQTPISYLIYIPD